MEIINQSVSSYKQKDFTLKSAYKAVERAARICYNSTNKITENSYKSFVKMLRKNKHTAPFAFGTIHIRIPLNTLTLKSGRYVNKITCANIFTTTTDIVEFFDKLPNSWAKVYSLGNTIYINTNLRVLEEWENIDSKKNISVLDLVRDYITNDYQIYFEERPFIVCTTNIAMSREFNRY